jgi:hypothetical protein
MPQQKQRSVKPLHRTPSASHHMQPPAPTAEQAELRATILRINGRAWGMAVGFLFGTILFLATNVLVAKGGPNVGAHLSLLSVYFPGYRVTFFGSLIGFVYAFVVGYGLGRLIGAVYNRFA